MDCRHHPDPDAVLPVCVLADTFGVGLPRRDLLLSPDHALFLNEVLIPVRHLVDDGAIARVTVNDVTYFHIELARHDVILAEGLPVESYLDTGDRASFANQAVTRLFPAFGAPPDANLVRDAYACAPLVITGPKLDAVRRRLPLQAAA